LEGPTVEIDETYVGGKRKGKFGRPAVGDTVKTPVVAIVQRKGKVIAKTVKAVTKKEIYPLIRKHVVPNSASMTAYQKSKYAVELVALSHTSTALFGTPMANTFAETHTPIRSKDSGCW
jgi:transposase-like protein